MKKVSAPDARPWLWHEAALRHLRDTLLRESNERRAASGGASERGGEDQVDRANVESARTELIAEWAHEEAELAEVEAALARIRDGTYGRCEVTGKPIEPERLRAIPWTRLSHEAAKDKPRSAT